MCFLLISILGCVFSVTGIVVICSGSLAISYFAACYALRYVAFPFLKSLHENWASYFVIKYSHIPVMDWINDIKLVFLNCLINSGIGFAGLFGALWEIQMFLWPYVGYLCISASGEKMYTIVKGLLDFEDEVRDACNKVGGILGINCDEKIDNAKLYTSIAGAIIALLMCTTLICACVMIYRIHRETGSYLFTFGGRVCCGGDGRQRQNEIAKGWEMQRRMRGRVRRGGVDEKDIEMRELRSSFSLSESSDDGRTFELPRLKL
ncbi:hypothetical protein JCM3765_001280 [Sporobolomyces pararoseus]